MKVAFLDRDGVINKEINYLYKINDFEYTSNCKEGLKILIQKGFQIIIVTNQAGIAKNIFSESDYYNLTNYYITELKNSGIEILDIFHCPHHHNAKNIKYKKRCNCRKPRPGLFLQAQNKYDIDMDNSITIGDKISDIEASIKAKVGRHFLVKSGHKIEITDDDRFDIHQDLFRVALSL